MLVGCSHLIYDFDGRHVRCGVVRSGRNLLRVWNWFAGNSLQGPLSVAAKLSHPDKHPWILVTDVELNKLDNRQASAQVVHGVSTWAPNLVVARRLRHQNFCQQ